MSYSSKPSAPPFWSWSIRHLSKNGSHLGQRSHLWIIHLYLGILLKTTREMSLLGLFLWRYCFFFVFFPLREKWLCDFVSWDLKGEAKKKCYLQNIDFLQRRRRQQQQQKHLLLYYYYYCCYYYRIDDKNWFSSLLSHVITPLYYLTLDRNMQFSVYTCDCLKVNNSCRSSSSSSTNSSRHCHLPCNRFHIIRIVSE